MMVATRNGLHTKPRRLTKIPSRVVKADDLAITVDGVDYFIHEGDWVEFVGGNGSLGDFFAAVDLLTTDLNNIDMDEEGKKSTRSASERLGEMVERLQSRIVEWHWTDQRGEVLPPHPSEKDLLSLDTAEITWLLTGGIRQEAPLVNE